MKRRFVPLIVSTTSDGAVELQQDWGDQKGDRISIPFHQLEPVIHWLQEAKLELEEKEEPVVREGELIDYSLPNS